MPSDPDFNPEPDEELESPFSGDDRPNSGLREGDISQDFAYLLDLDDIMGLHQHYLTMQEDEAISFRRARHLLIKMVSIAGTADSFQLGFEIEGALHYGQDDGPLLKGPEDQGELIERLRGFIPQNPLRQLL